MDLNSTFEQVTDTIIRTLPVDTYDTSEMIKDATNQSSPVVAKATAMAVLFLASLICGLLPIKLAQWFKWQSDDPTAHRTRAIVTFCLAFGGGVLLCTTFMHLLPEVGEGIRTLQEYNKMPLVPFNMAELLMCIGFFTMYFVEECVHSYLDRKNSRLNDDNHIENHREKPTATIHFKRGQQGTNSFIGSLKHQCDHTSVSRTDLISSELDRTCIPIDPIEKPDQFTIVPAGNHHNHGHSHLPKSIPNESLSISSLRGLLVVLALSVHELFEGLAVGLESSPSNVWYMFGAVAAHKLVLAFCVGVELITTRTKQWLAISYVVLFAVVSPLGIGIGILISSAATVDGDQYVPVNMTSVILQGIACGTLLYVVFFEILNKGHANGLMRYVAVLLGFLIMFGLQFLTHHEHSHHSDNSNHDHEHDDHDHDHDLHSRRCRQLELELKALKSVADQFVTIVQGDQR